MRSNGKGMAKNGKKTLFRLIRTIFGFFPVLMPLVLVCILFNAIVGSIPAIFMLFTVWLWQLPFFITGKWQRSPREL